MRAFVETNEPWEEYGLDPINEEEDPKTMEGKSRIERLKFNEGCSVLGSLQEFARAPILDDDDREWFNPDWIDDLNDWSQMEFMDSEDFRLWWLGAILGSDNDRRPHAHALLTHVNPLHDDKLTTGEMAVATGIIASRRCFQGFNDHRYTPVTIFSASFRSLRVLQVWHDREDPNSLHVRRSPIKDFMQGENANLEAWITLLCWVMGDQLDDTRGGQVSKTVEGQGIEAASAQPVGKVMQDQAGEVVKSPPSKAASGQPEDDQQDGHHSDTSFVDSNRSDTNSSEGTGSDDSMNGDSEETLSPGQGKATV
ncbi:hypothetical protein C8A01DRAFT_41531 [Parachaetomium inaequale]|uniref:Uncharacterized protein n=1 Tax=Parachaetomium inaequale TaxID=2588326 RepID=A0AAN6SLT0_9PEZI|nr:hypothetical protein C8A01DRAFT_41531 [Parachaetomium inaequale]